MTASPHLLRERERKKAIDGEKRERESFPAAGKRRGEEAAIGVRTVIVEEERKRRFFPATDERRGRAGRRPRP